MRATLFIFLLLFSIGIAAQPVKDTLRVGYYNAPPFVIEQEDGTLEGISHWMWNQLQADIQQPVSLISYDGGMPLNDILNDLQAGKIDMAINPLTLTNERHQIIDFSFPFFVGNLKAVEKGKTKRASVLNFFKGFFSWKIIYLILILGGLVIIFGFLMWLVERNNQHFQRGVQGLFSSFWWSAVTMTTVGYGDKVPISNAGRFIAFVWMLFSLISIAIFSAVITSSLTVHQLTEGERSIDDFKTSKVGTVVASATESHLKRNFFRNVQLFPDMNAGLDALTAEEIEVFIYDEPWLIYQLNNNPKYAELQFLPEALRVQLYAMPMRKGLDPELEKTIRTSLLKIMESRDWDAALAEYQLKQN